VPPATAGRPPVTDRAAWIRAATSALRAGGVDAVRIEALARLLGATKGSCYWHFRDRAELLEAMLLWWETETRWLIRTARDAPTPLARLDRYFTLVAATREYPPDVEIMTWARRDPAVLARVDRTERARLGFIQTQFRAAGFALPEARRRARIAYFATQGWVDRASRGRESYPALPGFARDLFHLLLGGGKAVSAPVD
jgi:AcrR family transcriptional regulator